MVISVYFWGDSSPSPTLQITYYDSKLPFRVDLQQKIDASTTFSLRRYYDGLGRQLQTQTANALVNGATRDILVDYAYDAYGRVTEQTVPYDLAPVSGYVSQTFSQAHSHTEYDLLGRPLSVTAPDGTGTSYAYSIVLDNGSYLMQNAVTDAGSQTTSTRSDAWGRTQKVIPPTGPGLIFNYNELDQLLSVQHGSLTSSMTYDKIGRKLSMNDPDMGAWTYSYDAIGNLTGQADARSCNLTLSYDLLNRLTNKSSNGAGCVTQMSSTYTYDAGTNGKGHRSGMSSGALSSSWTYDSRGRVSSEQVTNGGSYSTSWSYNSADLPVSMTYPGGEVVQYSYTPQMALNSLIGSSNYLTSSQFDAAGRVTQRNLGNGLSQAYSYYPWTQQGGRLQNLVTGTLQNLAYSYDAMGNILNITDALHGPQTQAFTYDALNRITSAAATGGSDGLYNEVYTYDPNTGNLSSKGGVTYAYDTNHPHVVAALSNGNSYGYDAIGNQTQRIVNGQTYTLAYDAENRLIAVSGPNLSAAFTYDADGKRVQQVLNGVTTKFIGNHYEVEGTTIRKYYFAGAVRVAMRTGSDAPVYFLQDHLGSTNITTDSSGNLISQLWYKAWGEVRYTSGTTPTKYTFTGQYSNTADFGLMFYGARWYDPALGRFAQADSLVPGVGNPQAYDRYAYVNNNPLIFIDPTGNMACNDWNDSCGNSYHSSFNYNSFDDFPTYSYSGNGRNFGSNNNDYSNSNSSDDYSDYGPDPNDIVTIAPIPPIKLHLYVYDVYYELRVSPAFGRGPVILYNDQFRIGPITVTDDGYYYYDIGPVYSSSGDINTEGTYRIGGKAGWETTGLQIGYEGISTNDSLGVLSESNLKMEWHPQRGLLVAAGIIIAIATPYAIPFFASLLQNLAPVLNGIE